MCKINGIRVQYYIAVIIFILAGYATYIEYTHKHKPIEEIPIDTIKIDTVQFDTMKLSVANIYFVCDSLKIPYKEIIVAQSILESAYFTSNLCVKKNNFLGLFNSSKQQYYSFNSWIDCLVAYKEWIQYKHIPGEGYFEFLERISYAEDSDYIRKVSYILDYLLEEYDERGFKLSCDSIA